MKKSSLSFCINILIAFFITLFFVFTSSESHARTDLFFLEPVSGVLGADVDVPFWIKGERLQAGSVDILVDTDYVEPVLDGDSQRVVTTKGPLAQQNSTYFFMASVLSSVYDLGRPSLKVIRFAFAFQKLANTNGVELLGKIKLHLKTKPTSGVSLLLIVKDGNRMGDLASYRQGGGAVFFVEAGKAPVTKINYPENGKRYETTTIALNGTVTTADGLAPQWMLWFNPFYLSDPLNTSEEAVFAYDTSSTYYTFTPGIHVVYFVAADSAGNIAASWSAFGVQESVVVTVLGAIRATVLEAVSGLPVSGAVVSVAQSVDGSTRILGTCITLETGVCTVEGLDEGTYSVTASKEEHESATALVYLPKDETVDVTLRILSLVTPSEDFYDYSTLNICVKANSTSGSAVPNATVRELRGTYACTTDAAGCCNIYRVRRDLNFYWVAYTDSLFSEITGPSALTKTQEKLTIPVAPPLSTGVRMELKDAYTLEPVSGVSVAAFAETALHASAVTDSTGKAELSPLETSTAYNMLVATGEQSGPDGTTWQASQSFTISNTKLKSGMILPVQLPFLGLMSSFTSKTDGSNPYQPGSLTMYVKSIEGNPLSGASVVIAQGTRTVSSLAASSSGLVQAPSLNPGTYNISVSKDGYQAVSFDFQMQGGQSANKYVFLYQRIAHVSWEEALGGGTTPTDCTSLDVLALNTSGASVAGLTAEVYKLIGGDVVASGTTGTDGHFIATGLTVEAIGVRLKNTGVTSGTLSWSEVREFYPVSLQQNKRVAYTFYVSPSSTSLTTAETSGTNPLLVEGKVVVKDTSGTTVANEKVVVESLVDGTTYNLTTDSTGVAKFQNDMPGNYRIRALPAGFQGIEYVATLSLGKVLTVTATLPRLPTIMRPTYTDCSGSGSTTSNAAFRVKALDAASGVALTGVNVRLLSSAGAILGSGTTGTTGEFYKDLLSSQTASFEVSWLDSKGFTEKIIVSNVQLKAGIIANYNVYIIKDGVVISDTDSSAGEDHQTKASITIDVKDTAGNAVSRVEASLIDASGRTVLTTSSDATGVISLQNISSGKYSLNLSHSSRIGLSISGINLWPSQAFKWQVVLPLLWQPTYGVNETGTSGAQIRAVVVDGKGFDSISNVTVKAKSLDTTSSSQELAAKVADSYGRIKLDGLSNAGPVSIDLSLSGYTSRSVSPVHMQSSGVSYALYPMTRTSQFTAISNPDNLKPSNVFFLTAKNVGIGQQNGQLVAFSYDPVRLEMKRLNALQLASSSSKLMAVGLAPLPQGNLVTQSVYQAFMKTAANQLTVYGIRSASGYSFFEQNKLTLMSDIVDVAVLNDLLAVATASGVSLYRISDEGATMKHVSHVALDVVRLIQEGDSLFAYTSDAKIVGIDASDPAAAIVTGSNPISSTVQMAAAASPYAVLSDKDSKIYPVKFPKFRLFGDAQASAISSTDIVPSGLSMKLDGTTGTLKLLKAFMIGSQGYGVALSEAGIHTVEFTDNVPILIQSFPLISSPQDMFITKKYVNGTWSNIMVSVTDAGFYMVELPAQTKSTVKVVADVTGYLPQNALSGSYRIYTAQGIMDSISTTTDGAGKTHYVWQSEIPAGVYDIALVDANSQSLLHASRISMLTDIIGDLGKVKTTMWLLNSAGIRTGAFKQDRDVFVQLSISALSSPLADLHFLVDFVPKGTTTQLSYYLTIAGSGFGYAPWQGTSSSYPAPLVTSWAVSPFSELSVQLPRFPSEFYSGGAGMLTFVLTNPGGHPLDAGAVISKSMAAFTVE